jgi:hypothetical protein
VEVAVGVGERLGHVVDVAVAVGVDLDEDPSARDVVGARGVADAPGDAALEVRIPRRAAAAVPSAGQRRVGAQGVVPIAEVLLAARAQQERAAEENMDSRLHREQYR